MRRLYDALKLHGFNPWLDKASMPNRGLQFTSEIASAIDSTDRVLLVLGPHALSSSYVEAEWRYALRAGKPIHPLLRQCDYTQLPGELAGFDARDFREHSAFERELERLISQISETPPPLGPLLGVPLLPAHYVPRGRDLDELRRLTIGGPGEAIALIGAAAVGAFGPGGRGKTTLAAALANDPQVRRTFPDGIIWLELGPNLDENTIVQLQQEAARRLGDAETRFTDPAAGRARLSTLLSERACLLILDNAWDVESLGWFAQNTLGPRCRALITTRDMGLLRTIGAETYPLASLASGDALLLLAHTSGWAVDSLPHSAIELATESRGEPHALATIGGTANGISDPWDELLNWWKTTDPASIHGISHDDPRWDALRPIHVSVERLEPSLKQRYLHLAVFRPGAAIPEAAVLTMWAGVPAFEARLSIRNLVDKALLRREADGSVSLHEHNSDYLRTVNEHLSQLHSQLIDSYSLICGGKWEAGPNDGYFHTHLAHHLSEAGRTNELRILLLNAEWLRKRVQSHKPNELISDFAFLHDDEEVSQVGQALSLSAHVLSTRPDQIACQLIGRLKPKGGITKLLDGLADSQPRPWLRPRQPSLTNPGPVRQTLRGHSGRVINIVLSSNHRYLLSTSSDGTARIWDLRTGESNPFPREVIPGVPIAVSPDGGSVLSRIRPQDDFDDDDEAETSNASAARDLVIYETLIKGPIDRAASRRPVWLKQKNPLRVELDRKSISAVCTEAANDSLITTGWRGAQRIDLTSGELKRLDAIPHDAVAIACGADGVSAAKIVEGITLEIMRAETGVRRLIDEQMGLGGIKEKLVTISANGARALWSCWDNTLRAWSDDESRVSLVGFARASALAIALDGTMAACGTWNGDVLLIDMAARFNSGIDHEKEITSVAVSPNNKWAVTASRDRSILAWNLRSGERRRLLGHRGAVYSAAISGDGSCIVSGGANDRELFVWTVSTGGLRRLEGHERVINSVAINFNGTLALSGSADQTVRVWNLKTGETRVLGSHDGIVRAVAMDPSARVALSYGDDRSLRMWRISDGNMKELGRSEGRLAVPGNPFPLAIFPDGTKAIAQLSAESLTEFDRTSGDTRELWRGRSVALAVTPRMDIVIAPAKTQSICWVDESGKMTAEFIADAPVTGVAVSCIGDVVVAGDRFGRIHVLDLIQ